MITHIKHEIGDRVRVAVPDHKRHDERRREPEHVVQGVLAMKLTATDRKWLGHIIASGGTPTGLTVPRRTFNRLRAAKLIEVITHPLPDTVCTEGRIYATAAGCVAFGTDQIARVAS